MPPIAPLTKVRLFAGREENTLEEPPRYRERVVEVEAGPALVILQTVLLPALIRPTEVRLSLGRTVAVDIAMATVGLNCRKARTDTEALNEAPVLPEGKKLIVVTIVFSLSDMFECEESDSPPPDYYIPRKKIQPCFLGLFPVLFIANG